MNPRAHTAALAAALAASVLPAAGSAAVPLIQPGSIEAGVASLPRLARPSTPAERRVDAALAGMNRSMPRVIQECRTSSPSPAAAGSYWSRTVKTTLAGPRLLSLLVTDDYFCGGAHPDTARQALVFDLRSGRLVDWRAFLPAALSGRVTVQAGADGVKTQRLASARLHAFYLAGYGATAQGGNPDCREAVTHTPDDPPSASVWPVAGGLALQLEVAHVAEACALPVIIPLATLTAAVARKALIAAIGAGSSPGR